MDHMTDQLSATELRDAFLAPNSSTRLRTAMAAGSSPSDGYVDVLVRQCAVEPDFFVRDMLTWALTRHDPARTVDRVLRELDSAIPQARSQALHTLTKIGDRSAWPAITPALLDDPDDEVARAAWRAAAGLVPAGREHVVAERLAGQFGRAGRDLQRSLSRAFAMLGAPAVPIVERSARARGAASVDDAAREHALATLRVIEDPEAGFDAAIAEARRIVALG